MYPECQRICAPDVSVPITLDGAPTGFTTPHTFTKTGTHTFTVPSADANGHPFYKWSTDVEITTITVSTAGTYTAYYGDLIIQYHDVAVTNIASSRTIAYQGYTIVDIYVEVTNEGTFSETFSVATYSNSTLLGNQTVTLAPNSNTILTFSWNTIKVSYGYYTLSANASRVPDEIDLTDNSLTDGTVIVTVPGDVSGDGKVDDFDLSRMCRAYGSTPTSPNWDMDCDTSGDLIVDGFDLNIAGKNYGKSTH